MMRLPCAASTVRVAQCAAVTSRQFVPPLARTTRSFSSVRRILLPTTSRQVFVPLHQWQPHRAFSDKLLGHSPMGAAPLPLSSQSTHIPTREEAEIGGVWVKESAKRDKLLELKSELATATADNAVPSLDAAATERQKLDLWLVDGLKLLALQTEQEVPTTTTTATTVTTTNSSNSHHENLQPIALSIHEKLDKLPDHLHQVQWEEFLLDIKQDLTQRLNSFPAGRCFLPIRDYYDASSEVATAEKEKRPLSNEVRQWIERQQQQQQQQTSDPTLWNSFTEAATRVRLQTVVALADQLQASWKTLTAATHQDVDRAAVRHRVVGDATTLPRAKLLKLLEAFLRGSGADRFDALWHLMDKDGDGLLDQEEVQHVANLAVAPVQAALQTVLQEALDASPVGGGEPAAGWRQRRREAREKKRLAKMFGRAVRRFFVEDLQQPHRLRCVYAWANKAHQDNKVDSVLVEEEGEAGGGGGGGGGVGTTLMGRKRYVELQPKISLPEFREVQSVHFPQLDHVGSELLESFRDDLLVDQGKGRQRRELLRDCALFFVGVCAADYVILAL